MDNCLRWEMQPARPHVCLAIMLDFTGRSGTPTYPQMNLACPVFLFVPYFFFVLFFLFLITKPLSDFFLFFFALGEKK